MNNRSSVDCSDKMFPKDKLMLERTDMYNTIAPVQLRVEQCPTNCTKERLFHNYCSAFSEANFFFFFKLYLVLVRYSCVECRRTRNPSGL